MKHLLLVIMLTIIGSKVMVAQTQTYKNESVGIGFSYPSSLHKENIKNASHMLLKLGKGDMSLALSMWAYGLDPSFSIWDEDIVQLTRDNLKRTGTSIVAINKQTLNLKSGKRKCLISIANDSRRSVHMVTYQFLRKGDLIQIVIMDRGAYKKQLQAQYDKYVDGLFLE